MAREINHQYKIIAICQVYNELEKGNLKRFFEQITPLVDAVIAYDDGSTDGSYEYLQAQTPHVLRGSRNEFAHEVSHKQQLLAKALELKPDFIFYLDADEVLSADAKEVLQNLGQYCIDHDLDGLEWQKINLWRSHSWKRVDSLFNEGWATNFWRVRPGIAFESVKPGLHQPLYPSTIRKTEKTDKLKVIHYGFADDLQLAYKYFTYRSHGQRGYVMLDRLINEEQRQLEKVSPELFPPKLWQDDAEPPQRTFLEALTTIEQYRNQVQRPKYSIVCLIYKSVEWLKFIHEQVLKYTDMSDKEFFFVANDATPEVLEYLKNNYLPHYIWTNSEAQRQEWYINNVYRAWNFGAQQARGDFVIFINSDMGLTPDWIENLFAVYNGHNCVASRLVESGKMKSGLHGIEKNFGQLLADYQEDRFQQYAQTIARDEVHEGGLYMPLLIRRDHFLMVDGYPEGNVVPGSDNFKPKIAKQGEPVTSGDVVLMDKLKSKGISHQTAFNSIVYHFQEGEMDSQGSTAYREKKEIAIANDLVTGTMGERVLWDFMLEGLPGAYGVDERVVGREGSFEAQAKVYIDKEHPQTDLIIQNATFIGCIDPNRYTVGFLQDNLRSMNRLSKQQERNLQQSSRLVTNSYTTALAYPEYDFDIIPVGVDAELYRPMNKVKLRQELGITAKKVGIFVGNFSEVKGWSKIKECIEKFPETTWLLVTKRNEDFQAPNVKVYQRIKQDLLAKLLNCADFFIIGSPVETQCLAAIEACLCDLPVVMRPVGIFKDWTEEERATVGIFSEDFVDAIKRLDKQKFKPRQMIIQKGLTLQDSIARWRNLLTSIFQEQTIARLKPHATERKPSSNLAFEFEFFYRYRILRPLFGKEAVSITDFIAILERLLPQSLFSWLRDRWRAILALKRRG